MRYALLLTTLVALAPLRADNTAAAAPTTAEERARRAWERFNTAAVVGNVDGQPITAEDVRNEMRPIAQRLRQDAKSQEELMAKLEEIRGKVLDELTERALILREFKDKGMQFPPSVVNTEVEEKIIREYNGDRTEYLKHLRLMGKTPIDDRKEIEERIAVDYLSNQIRRSVGELSPEKINRDYQQNKEAFKQRAAVKLAQIALWADATESDEDVRQRAAEIITRLNKGESFAELAKQFSKDDYREQGGDTDWREMVSLNDDIAKTVNTLTDGAHSAPIEFKAGGRLSLYILRRVAYRPEGSLPFEEVRDRIEARLMVNDMRSAREEWIARLRDRFYIRYYN